MNYEQLLIKMQNYEKDMKDTLSAQQKYLKNLSKNTEKGDLKAWSKDAASLEEAQEKSREILEKMKEEISEFDIKTYFTTGEFSEQMLDFCGQYDLDVKGTFPTYEMFPYKIKIDAENLDIYVDKKKVQSVRPLSFVLDVKTGREKLLRTSFKAAAFGKELAAAYDLALLANSKGKPYAPNKEMYLPTLYKFLTPMKRFRKDYDMQSYAFDLARLYSSDDKEIDDGRKIDIGTSRDIKNAIRVLDIYGQEQFLSTIRFY
ncbi:MAG: hypothetical protein RRY25_05320 [Anaerovorax sp.]